MVKDLPHWHVYRREDRLITGFGEDDFGDGGLEIVVIDDACDPVDMAFSCTVAFCGGATIGEAENELEREEASSEGKN